MVSFQVAACDKCRLCNPVSFRVDSEGTFPRRGVVPLEQAVSIMLESEAEKPGIRYSFADVVVGSLDFH